MEKEVYALILKTVKDQLLEAESQKRKGVPRESSYWAGAVFHLRQAVLLMDIPEKVKS